MTPLLKAQTSFLTHALQNMGQQSTVDLAQAQSTHRSELSGADVHAFDHFARGLTHGGVTMTSVASAFLQMVMPKAHASISQGIEQIEGLLQRGAGEGELAPAMADHTARMETFSNLTNLLHTLQMEDTRHEARMEGLT